MWPAAFTRLPPPLPRARDKSFLAMVVDIVRELKQQNPRLVYGRRGSTLGPGCPGKGRVSFLPPLRPSVPRLPGPVSCICQASEDVGLLKSAGYKHLPTPCDRQIRTHRRHVTGKSARADAM
ncbi:hypothetical protein P7K49_032483 [Saguinus oedipus]|uniref:Uncharacterized protein n=1 Tax=Saguinus oedipus TaxID=9490 RepID=A0ABQ9TYC9_SAGOE|nr:hypothetical protein P7K49_032483 [Saguinus oedipus]